jgi:hypothetical protein
VLNIRVTATDTAGASASTNFKLTVSEFTSSDQLNGQDDGVRMFPNPAHEMVTLSLEAHQAKTATVWVRNLAGEEVCRHTFRDSIKLNLAEKPKGLYIMHLQVDQGVVIRKLCIN